MTLEINKRGAILTVLILCSIGYILYSTSDEIKGTGPGQGDSLSANEKDTILHGDKELDAEKAPADHEIEIGADVEYVEDYISVNNIKVYYRYAITAAKDFPPPRFPILLLHGMRFSSQNWKSIGTLQFLRKSGYFPIAVDLPQYGKTTEAYGGSRENFLPELIAALPHAKKPVLVSPSMSGMYAIPFVLNHANELRGFIPIAPVNRHTEDDFKKVSLPTLIIYGGDDTTGKKTSLLLGNIPNSRIEEIQEVGHAAYMEDTAQFHTLIKKFLDEIHEKEKKSGQISHDFDGTKL